MNDLSGNISSLLVKYYDRGVVIVTFYGFDILLLCKHAYLHFFLLYYDEIYCDYANGKWFWRCRW